MYPLDLSTNKLATDKTDCEPRHDPRTRKTPALNMSRCFLDWQSATTPYSCARMVCTVTCLTGRSFSSARRVMSSR